jgi:hypothetical protein
MYLTSCIFVHNLVVLIGDHCEYCFRESFVRWIDFALQLFLQLLTQSGRTALIQAAQNGHTDCVRLLVQAGADKDAKDNVRVSLVSRMFFRFADDYSIERV